MKLGTMFQDVSSSFLRKPVTEKYPFERRTPPTRLRGTLVWDAETCVGCGLCATDCPANALEVFVLDRKEKRFALSYHPDRCTFCAQCVSSCRHGSLAMSNEVWELAALDRTSFTIHFGDETDVELALAGKTASNAEASSE
ncbi:MAG TPA: 4Fe-4S binding protein [Anaerolineae bacterium]|nr:4Fe-4S binding protein [Anaerolineae bacterium]